MHMLYTDFILVFCVVFSLFVEFVMFEVLVAFCRNFYIFRFIEGSR